MKLQVFILGTLLSILSINCFATTYYVATDGDDSNSGTSVSSPFANLSKAISSAEAGDIIYVRGGTYEYSSKISISKSGTSDNPITIEAYENEKPIFDFSSMSTSSSNRAFSLSSDYWVIKGLKICEAGDNGMHISGSYNTIENCTFFKNRDTGLQLSNGASNNNIINCDSYGNADPTDYGDADGFACKMDVGDNNYFYGCRAWANVDDGWDGYMRGADDVNTTLENCWTWMNGYFLDGTDGGASANGNGFKVGGSDNKTLMHNFTLINCVAFDNKSKGFDQNNNKGDMKFYNCTAYRNTGYNYSIQKSLNSGKVAEVYNCISIDGNYKLGSFVDDTNNSWNGYTFDENDFVSLDTTGVSGSRNDDGSLPEIDMFRLSSNSTFIDAGTDLGYAYNGSAPDLGAFESIKAGVNNSTFSDNFSAIVIGEQSTSELLLKIYSTKDIYSTIKIISILGGIEFESQQEISQGNQFLTFDINNLQSGLHIVSIESSNGMCNIKFSKQ